MLRFPILVLFLVATHSVLAQGVTCWGIQGYVSDPKLVFTFNSENPSTVTVIGSTQTVGVTFEGLEFHPDGNLYAYGRSSDALQTGLYLVSQSTGAVTYIGGGSTGGEWVRGLAYDPSTGQLLATTRNGASTSVYEIDVLTGAPTLLETVPSPRRGDGIAVDPSGERFLLDAAQNRIYRECDPSGYSPLGPVGLNLYFESGIVIDWSRDSTLYVVSWQFGGSSLYLVDPNDGTTNSLGLIGTSSGQQYYPTDVAFPLDAGVGPVIPEPDCNANGVPDHCEIATSAVTDLDTNGIPDLCDISAGAPDCDSDGTLDVANRVETTSYVLGTGIRMAIGDVDVNGSPDIVLSDVFDGEITLLLNDGTGHFTTGPTLLYPSPRQLAVADFDSDGSNDLLVAGSADISILFNDGFGDFSAPQAVVGHTGTLHLTDLNEDGLSDFVVVDTSADLVHLDIATSPTTFTSSTVPLSGNFVRGSTVGDFNGDDHVDFLLIYANQGAFLYPGNGAGGLLPPLDLDASLSHKVAVLDANGDGILDLVERRENSSSREFRLFLGEGSGDFTLSWTQPAGSDPWAVRSWDSNGNGHESVIFTEENSRLLTIYRWNAGQLTPYQEFPLHRNIGRINFDLDDPDTIAIEDFDGDGQEDIAILVLPEGSVSVLLQLESDCDLNGIIDSCDFAAGGDSDGNGILDLCESIQFLRGDVNTDATVDIGDPIDLLGRLFSGIGPAPCRAAADANSDAAIDIADVIYLLGFLFNNGTAPLPPFPTCGPSFDPADAGLGCIVEGC